MQRKLNYSIRCLLLGLLSIVIGIMALIIGYGVLPERISKDLIETIYTFTIESVPIALFGFGVLFSLAGIFQKNVRLGTALTLFLNITPLVILIYIISE